MVSLHIPSIIRFCQEMAQSEKCTYQVETQHFNMYLVTYLS